MYKEDLGEDELLLVVAAVAAVVVVENGESEEANLFWAWTNRADAGDDGAVKADTSCVVVEAAMAATATAATIAVIDVPDVEFFIFFFPFDIIE